MKMQAPGMFGRSRSEPGVMVTRFRSANPWIGLATGLLTALPLGAAAAGNVVQTEQVRAELVAHAPDGVAPGKTLWLGLRLEHIPHWHTYWKNAGDSGLPTTMQLDAARGRRGRRDRLARAQTTSHRAAAQLRLRRHGAAAGPGDDLACHPRRCGLHVKLEADWLVCKIECIPQYGTFELDVPVTGRPPRTPRSSSRRWPRARERDRRRSATRAWPTTRCSSRRWLPATVQGRKALVFPEIAGVVDNPAPVASNGTAKRGPRSWPLSAQRSESPAHLPLVLSVRRRQAAFAWSRRLATAWPGAERGEPARRRPGRCARRSANPASSPRCCSPC